MNGVVKALRYLPKITNSDDTDNDDYQKSPGSFSGFL